MPRCAPNRGCSPFAKALGLFANLRPVTLHPALLDASTIKPEVLSGTDIMVVRELTGGIYFGEKTRTATSASDLCTYTVEEIERVVRVAGKLAHAPSQARSRRSTRPTCWRPRACGVRSPSAC